MVALAATHKILCWALHTASRLDVAPVPLLPTTNPPSVPLPHLETLQEPFLLEQEMLLALMQYGTPPF